MTECYLDKFLFNDRQYYRDEFDETVFASHNCVYEVIRLIRSVPVFVDSHFDRLMQSAQQINLPFNWHLISFMNTIERVRRINDVEAGNVKLVFFEPTAVGSTELQKLIVPNKLNYLAYFNFPIYPKPDEYIIGVAVELIDAERKNPSVKIVNPSLRSRANELIKKHNLNEVILVDSDGYITEGSRSNIFFIKDNVIYTPPASTALLGVTRQQILGICDKLSIKVVEKKIHSSEIQQYETVFISSTSRRALPVATIDDKRFAVNNIILKQIMTEFDATVEQFIHDFEKKYFSFNEKKS